MHYSCSLFNRDKSIESSLISVLILKWLPSFTRHNIYHSTLCSTIRHRALCDCLPLNHLLIELFDYYQIEQTRTFQLLPHMLVFGIQRPSGLIRLEKLHCMTGHWTTSPKSIEISMDLLNTWEIIE